MHRQNQRKRVSRGEGRDTHWITALKARNKGKKGNEDRYATRREKNNGPEQTHYGIEILN